MFERGRKGQGRAQLRCGLDLDPLRDVGHDLARRRGRRRDLGPRLPDPRVVRRVGRLRRRQHELRGAVEERRGGVGAGPEEVRRPPRRRPRPVRRDVPADPGGVPRPLGREPVGEAVRAVPLLGLAGGW